MNSIWPRRTWLTTMATQTGALVALVPGRIVSGTGILLSAARPVHSVVTTRMVPDIQALQQLAQRAVEAARAAGADYTDARLTRSVVQSWSFGYNTCTDEEVVGVGVRALVHGYWGFSACPLWVGDPAGSDIVVRLARAAVVQATVNAKGTPRTVALGPAVMPTGTWATPVKIDPFAVSLEEKWDAMAYWVACANTIGLHVDIQRSWMKFARQERVVATSDGAVYAQTCYESGGGIAVKLPPKSIQEEFAQLGKGGVSLLGLEISGKGWEVFLEANIPEQIRASRESILAEQALDAEARQFDIGRYTLVCDGTTMASLLERTLGTATQLDRALGYEANAGGTSFLDDPLGMVGNFPVAAPHVTVTANRTAPAQLATVQWDDEGVTPQPFTLVKDGVLSDFQTTREQAAWLAPYYQRQGRPVRSNGCAAAEDGLCITMQHMPNLALEPSAAAIRLADLVADVKDGILIEGGEARHVDFQAKNGLVFGSMRKIANGRLGARLSGGAVQFNTLDLWKRILAVGGAPTQAVHGSSQYLSSLVGGGGKGEPPQVTSHSVQAVAATIADQPIIDALRKA